MDSQVKWPEMPATRAQWTPVYIEPMAGSGERLTVAIAAWGDSGIDVVPSLAEPALRCAFGQNGVSLLEQAQMLCGSLKSHLDANGTPEGWESPLSGVALGPIRDGAGDTLTEVIRLGMRRTACFSALLDVGNVEVEARLRTDDRWTRQIRNTVMELRPDLDKNFSKPIQVLEGGRNVRIDYASERFALNFTRLNPHRMAEDVMHAKAQVVDLEMVRNSHGAFTLPSYEIFILRPRLDDPNYSERQIEALEQAVRTLEELSKERELERAHFTNADDAAGRIVSQEAA